MDQPSSAYFLLRFLELPDTESVREWLGEVQCLMPLVLAVATRVDPKVTTRRKK
jgi:hypothetical protein